MRKLSIVTIATVALSAAAFGAGTKTAVKISMQQARKIALQKVPGKIKSEELENEKGKRIYSFDIKTAKQGIIEVNVDAMNGAIIEVKQESAAKEAAEKKQEAKEKTKH